MYDLLWNKTIILINSLVMTIVYFIPLYIVSPIIDDIFGPLDKNESIWTLSLEITTHILILALSWNLINVFVGFILKKVFMKLKLNKSNFNLIYNNLINGFVSSIILVGLQKNLMAKLRYISWDHPLKAIWDRMKLYSPIKF